MGEVSVMSWGNPKTGEEIEQDLYGIVRTTIKDSISGYVYRKDARPTNRKDKEDAVVSFLSGLDGQTQTGVVVVNCYVPYLIGGDNYKVKDVKRATEVARLLLDVVKNHKTGDYLLRTDRTVETVEEEEVSRCTLRIKFMYNTLNKQ